ncbi:hypothetical protein [Micromonospora sp. NBC_00421]|uniref:hypothetical protein n=1 Tax=Micromonospora sp. NBC_00421 TaxID=2975976 RepID=UPI002E21EED8
MDTIPADLFFATVTPGTRFRAWPTTGRNVHAGLILTAVTPPTRNDDGDLYVPFAYPRWTNLGGGAVYRDNPDRYELVAAGAVDVCSCGEPGSIVPDPHLTADGRHDTAAMLPVMLCPTCLVQVTALAHAD